MSNPGNGTSQNSTFFLLMTNLQTAQEWKEYVNYEQTHLLPLLTQLGFTLDTAQVHIDGERFLMMGERDVGGGGKKLVLTGREIKTGMKVLIKASSDIRGMQEIARERKARETLRTLTFAYAHLISPPEILYHLSHGILLHITEFIEQDRTFLDRPIEEQFSLLLSALKSQEGMHATTYAHTKVIRPTLGLWNAHDYQKSFTMFHERARARDPLNRELREALSHAHTVLEKNRLTIDQYCGFLTHADFVPHNLRVRGTNLYLLDYASLHFGNKHESWARMLNFMLLYNRPLEEVFVEYLKKNRTPEESNSLRIMRIYKLGKLLEYHTSTLPRTTGDLHVLGEERVTFWTHVLNSLLEEKILDQTIVEHYQHARDRLRSSKEKERQKELH